MGAPVLAGPPIHSIRLVQDGLVPSVACNAIENATWDEAVEHGERHWIMETHAHHQAGSKGIRA